MAGPKPLNPPVETLFQETQTFRRVYWVMALVVGIAGLQWWFFFVQIIQGRPAGSNPAPDWMLILFWLLFGIGLPLFFWVMALEVTVDLEKVIIRFRPLSRRVIAADEIKSAEAVVYRPLLDFGGWGIRGLGGRRAYSISGNRAVELHLTSGDMVVVGTNKSEALERAVNLAREYSRER